LRRLFVLIVLASALTLLAALWFVYLIYRQQQQRLKDLVHLETENLLAAQAALNQSLLQANAVLQVSEEKLAVTLNSIGDAVIATDAQARVTMLNPLAEQLTGWTQSQANGHAIDEIFQIVNKETRQPATIPVMSALTHGTVQGLANHTVLLARDGLEYDIADSCAPIRSREGEVIGAVLVFRNVTTEYAVQHTLRLQQAELAMQNEELIRSEQALEISRSRYFDLYDLAPIGYFTVSESGDIIEANLAAATLLGVARGMLVKLPFSRFLPRQDADSFHLLSQRLMATGVSQTSECRMLKIDGTQFWVDLTATAAQDGGMPVQRIMINDVTARKQTEEELLKTGALQSAIFNSANFSSIATDAKGVIQIFNVGAERMLGYMAAEVVNQRTPADISDPQEIIARAKTLSAELATEINPGFEALVFKASRGIEDIY
jgi:PAS domain S-box-containing protein